MRPCTHHICSPEPCYNLNKEERLHIGDRVVFKVSGELGRISAIIEDMAVVSVKGDMKLLKVEQLRKALSKGQQRRLRKKEQVKKLP
jgi:hypothetical protein